MPLKLKVQLDGKESTYERKRPPMLENLLDALKIQRLETEMYGGESGPTDAQNAKRMDLYAEFATRFWGQGMTKKDILRGVSSVEGLNQIVEAVNLTLGYNDDDEDTDEDAKGDKKPAKK